MVYSFDINHWRYTEPMANYLKQKHPGRLKTCFGDSTQTVPLVAENTIIKCDIAVVDGGHDKDIPMRDIINMKLLSHNETLLLVDDIGSNKKAVLNTIITLDKVGFIKKVFACSDEIMYGGFAAFNYP